MMFATLKCKNKQMNKKNKILKIINSTLLFIIIFSSFVFFKSAFAQPANNCEALGSGRKCYDVGSQYNVCKNTAGCIVDLCTGNTTICCLETAYNQCIASSDAQDTGKTIPNPIGTTDIKVLISRIINTILGIIGSLALALFVYGGLTFMTAGGKPEQIQKGKDTLVWAVIGLAVIFTSYVILNFVFQTLVKINS